MFLLTKPSMQTVRRFLDSQSEAQFSYPAVGATSTGPPPGYDVDHTRIRLGAGQSDFTAAKTALQAWKHFQLGWVEPCWQDTPIAPGEVVGVLAHVLGLWSLNACRIVFTVDERGSDTRCGFAYGTLPDHVESGEERFTIEWHQADDSVWYDILAFSRPHHLLARLGYPLVRRLQKRFARDSAQAMMQAVRKTA